MVCINSAIGNTNDNTRAVEADEPIRMFGQGAVFKQGRCLTVACLWLEDRLNPQYTIHFQEGLKSVDVRCIKGHGSRKIPADVERCGLDRQPESFDHVLNVVNTFLREPGLKQDPIFNWLTWHLKGSTYLSVF